MDYFLGSSDVEHERLIRQAARVAPVTERFFREAGIGPGQRVLDLGSGVGDVAMLVAGLVGRSGEVVGVERDPCSIQRARARVAKAGFGNVTFVEADLEHFDCDMRFDAAVGRWILQFLPDPVATLRAVARTVYPGGTVAFQEVSFAPYTALSATLPLWSRVAALNEHVARRAGVNTEMGPALHRAFVEAGLPAPCMRVEIELGRDEDFARNVADATVSIVPQMERFRISLEAVGDLHTLEERLYEELAASGAVVPWFPLVGAWCQLPFFRFCT